MSKLKFGQALYDSREVIPFLAEMQAPKNAVGKQGNIRQGLCASHSAQMNGNNEFAKLSTAAFFLNAVVKKALSCGVSEQKGYIFGELTVGNNDVRRFLCRRDNIILLDVLPNQYACLPIVLYAVFFNPNLKMYYEEFIKSPDPTTTLRFCDSFWYDYAKEAADIEVSNDSSMLPQIQTAYRAGEIEDKSAYVYGNPCISFANITPRTSRDNVGKNLADFEEYRKGTHKIAYEWAEEQKSRIRPLSFLDDFVPTASFFKIMKKIDYRVGSNMLTYLDLQATDMETIKQDFVNILLYGDPGTGKTALANAVSAATGMPIYEVTFNEDSEDDEFEGKNKIINGTLSFVETGFLEAFEKGGIILMEEINLARANVFTSVINQALEYPYFIKKNGYERIERHPLTVIIATMNIDTEGTTAVNSSSSQRFLFKYMIEEASDDEFKNMLFKRGFDKRTVRYVYETYKKIRTDLKSTDQKRRYLKEMSIRQCLSALYSIEEGIDEKEAIKDSMYGALAVKNKKIADTIKTSILDNMIDFSNFR